MSVIPVVSVIPVMCVLTTGNKHNLKGKGGGGLPFITGVHTEFVRNRSCTTTNDVRPVKTLSEDAGKRERARTRPRWNKRP